MKKSNKKKRAPYGMVVTTVALNYFELEKKFGPSYYASPICTRYLDAQAACIVFKVSNLSTSNHYSIGPEHYSAPKGYPSNYTWYEVFQWAASKFSEKTHPKGVVSMHEFKKKITQILRSKEKAKPYHDLIDRFQYMYGAPNNRVIAFALTKSTYPQEIRFP